MNTFPLALGIFILTYLFISVRNIPGIKIGRSSAALIGATLMVGLGVVSFPRALSSIDVEVIILLLGMMLLVSSLQNCGLFEIICAKILRLSSTPLRFFILIMVVSAVLSALVLNDAVVLLFTPVIIEACYRLRVNPFPYLIGEVMAANIGSVATVVGNPQNAYIGTKAGISFLEFSATLLPVAALCLLSSTLFLVFIFRKDVLFHTFSAPSEIESFLNPSRAEQSKDKERTRQGILTSGLVLKILVILTIATVMMFAFSNALGIPLYTIAIGSGLLAAFISIFLNDSRVKDIGKGVDWSIILFFIGLFVVIQGAIDSGLLSQLEHYFFLWSGTTSLDVVNIGLLSAFMSNLVSNVPSVMLLGELISLQDTSLWLALAASSTLAGNATLMGSAANIIMAEKAEKMGHVINFWKFMLIGIPVTMLNLGICILLLSI